MIEILSRSEITNNYTDLAKIMGKAVRVLPGSQLEPLNDIGRFLSMLRFDSREKAQDLMEKGGK